MLRSQNRRPSRRTVRARARTSTQPLKRAGEDAAAGMLEGKGYRVLSRNWRTRFGELDLVAMDGSTLVFVEVKARQVDRFVDPALGVDFPKQKKVRRLAEAYLAFQNPPHESCRFDVVSVVSGEGPVRISHIQNAF